MIPQSSTVLYIVGVLGFLGNVSRIQTDKKSLYYMEVELADRSTNTNAHASGASSDAGGGGGHKPCYRDIYQAGSEKGQMVKKAWKASYNFPPSPNLQLYQKGGVWPNGLLPAPIEHRTL